MPVQCNPADGGRAVNIDIVAAAVEQSSRGDGDDL